MADRVPRFRRARVLPAQLLYNPLDNAKAAVALSGNTMAGLLSNWTAYEPAGAAAAIVKQNGGAIPATTGVHPSSTTGTGTVQGIQGNVPGVSAPGATPSGGIIPGGHHNHPRHPLEHGPAVDPRPALRAPLRRVARPWTTSSGCSAGVRGGGWCSP